MRKTDFVCAKTKPQINISIMHLLSKSNSKLLAFFCDCTACFVSDLVENPDCWFSQVKARIFIFSGYDFGYLLKVLTDSNLPVDEEEFFTLMKIYFPNIYDVKYLMKSCKNLKGGLQEVAEQLEVGHCSIYMYFKNV